MPPLAVTAVRLARHRADLGARACQRGGEPGLPKRFALVIDRRNRHAGQAWPLHGAEHRAAFDRRRFRERRSRIACRFGHDLALIRLETRVPRQLLAGHPERAAGRGDIMDGLLVERRVDMGGDAKGRLAGRVPIEDYDAALGGDNHGTVPL